MARDDPDERRRKTSHAPTGPAGGLLVLPGSGPVAPSTNTHIMNLATIISLIAIRPVLVTNLGEDDRDLFLGICREGDNQRLLHYAYNSGRVLFWADKDDDTLNRPAHRIGVAASMAVDCIHIKWHD